MHRCRNQNMPPEVPTRRHASARTPHRMSCVSKFSLNMAESRRRKVRIRETTLSHCFSFPSSLSALSCSPSSTFSFGPLCYSHAVHTRSVLSLVWSILSYSLSLSLYLSPTKLFSLSLQPFSSI